MNAHSMVMTGADIARWRSARHCGAVTFVCPKCSFENAPAHRACARCGVVFAKLMHPRTRPAPRIVQATRVAPAISFAAVFVATALFASTFAAALLLWHA